MQMPWLQMWASDSLYSMSSLLPLAPKRDSLVFLQNLIGTRPSWRQFKAAPESIKATISMANLFLITRVRETSHLWKITLLTVFKYASASSSLACEDSGTSSRFSWLSTRLPTIILLICSWRLKNPKLVNCLKSLISFLYCFTSSWRSLMVVFGSLLVKSC